MIICLICNQISAWGKIGGFGTNTRRLGQALVKQGIKVHVVVPRRGKQKKEEDLDGMIIHGLSKFEIFFDRTIYKKIDADVYHSEEPQICTYMALKAMPHKSHMVTCRDPREFSDWVIHFRYATWNRRIKFITQLFYENSPLVHFAVRKADAQFVEYDFLRLKAKKVYRLKQSPKLLPKPLPIPKGPFEKSTTPLCVFLGRFDPIKRPELFFRLAKELPQIDFIAIGTVEYPNYFQKITTGYDKLPNLQIIKNVDPFSTDTITKILAKAWILVHTSVKEAFPTVFAEASVHEASIVAYLNPDNYVSTYGNVVEKKHDFTSLKKALLKTINSSEWINKGKAARLYNIQHHHINKCVSMHIAAYQNCIHNNKRSLEN